MAQRVSGVCAVSRRCNVILRHFKACTYAVNIFEDTCRVYITGKDAVSALAEASSALFLPMRWGISFKNPPKPERSYRKSDISSTATKAPVSCVDSLPGTHGGIEVMYLSVGAGAGEDRGFNCAHAGCRAAGFSCLNMYRFLPRPTQGMRRRVHLEHAGSVRSH